MMMVDVIEAKFRFSPSLRRVGSLTDLCCRRGSKNASKEKEGRSPFAGVSLGKVQSKQLARRAATNFLDR